MTESALAMTACTADVDRTLVQRSTAGDRDAYDELLSDRLQGLYHTALGILRVDADAQDAVQDTCVQAWRHLRSLREPERFDAWLGRILVNECRARLRTRRRARVREIDMSTIAGGEDGPEVARSSSDTSLADRVANTDAIRRAFDRLKPDQRIVLGLHHAARRSIQEMAALLDIPEGTAKWRLFDARRALAAALERER